MKHINFKIIRRRMALTSWVGGIFLVVSIIGYIIKSNYVCIYSFLIYLCSKVLENIIWRCPKCKSKLPKGEYSYNIKKCSYCNYDLL